MVYSAVCTLLAALCYGPNHGPELSARPAQGRPPLQRGKRPRHILRGAARGKRRRMAARNAGQTWPIGWPPSAPHSTGQRRGSPANRAHNAHPLHNIQRKTNEACSGACRSEHRVDSRWEWRKARRRNTVWANGGNASRASRSATHRWSPRASMPRAAKSMATGGSGRSAIAAGRAASIFTAAGAECQKSRRGSMRASSEAIASEIPSVALAWAGELSATRARTEVDTMSDVRTGVRIPRALTTATTLAGMAHRHNRRQHGILRQAKAGVHKYAGREETQVAHNANACRGDRPAAFTRRASSARTLGSSSHAPGSDTGPMGTTRCHARDPRSRRHRCAELALDRRHVPDEAGDHLSFAGGPDRRRQDHEGGGEPGGGLHQVSRGHRRRREWPPSS